MPICTKCHHEKPEDRFKWCEPCRQKGRRKAHARRVKYPEKVRQSKQQEYKKNKERILAYWHTYYKEHKEKVSNQTKEYRRQHAERLRARRKAYYEKNKEIFKAKKRAWYYANAEKARAYSRQWSLEHPEQTRTKHKAWRQRHPEDVYKYVLIRRARKAAAPRMEMIDRMVIYRRDNGKCHLCHRKVSVTGFHIDHLVPLSRGGNHTYDNLALAHPRCNQQRGPGRLPAQLRLLP